MDGSMKRGRAIDGFGVHIDTAGDEHADKSLVSALDRIGKPAIRGPEAGGRQKDCDDGRGAEISPIH
jgi:hypothetical protein